MDAPELLAEAEGVVSINGVRKKKPGDSVFQRIAKESIADGTKTKLTNSPMRDEYLEAINMQWDNILKLYKKLEDYRPIMLYDVSEQKICAYPYRDSKSDLKKENQESLKFQYKKALGKKTMIVFVRDSENRKMVSYSLDY